MRKVISFSLDAKTINKVKKQSRQFGFANVSQYVRHLVAGYDDIITEDELVKMARSAEKEYREGKTIKANSLADLL